MLTLYDNLYEPNIIPYGLKEFTYQLIKNIVHIILG